VSDQFDSNERPDFDSEIKEIASYVSQPLTASQEAKDTAYACLLDSLGCGLLALRYPECTKHLGPRLGLDASAGQVRVPGTHFKLDPEKAAWDIGCIIRWLDYNDTWLAAEWGHPSDNLGAILAVADFVSQQNRATSKAPVGLDTVLEAMIKAHEIQGNLAIKNSFNRVGLDHVLLVKVASTAVATWLMGGSQQQIEVALSHAWVDGHALRTYRHAPNAGSRKSWAAGDACGRAIRLADIALRGEMGIPGALSAPQWGFYDVLFSKTNRDQQIKPENERRFLFERDYGCYVMENILFKLSFPAEFHAQTACEAAIKLHDQVKGRLDAIERIEITTHESAIRIISKRGALNNPADRDHCLQYMTAVCLAYGELNADHYEDSFHEQHPEIDQLRELMEVSEKESFSADYLDPDKRSIANAVQVFFKDGSKTEQVVVEYPIGHRKRREEGMKVLKSKFLANLKTCFPSERAHRIMAQCDDSSATKDLAADEFIQLFAMS
jgi:2-methylcitrate dehydratase